jgi:PAS domain S-box-containing protein
MTLKAAVNSTEERILVLAPRGRDAQVIAQVLAGSALTCATCGDYPALMRELDAGAGAAVIAEEALHGADLDLLTAWLAQQASWSDFPFVLLVSRQAAPRKEAARILLGNAANVLLLERPLNAETIRRATVSALRARKRQYQARSDLEVRIRAEERLHIALDAGRLGAWEVDLPGMELQASDTCKRNFGQDPLLPFSYDRLVSAIHEEDRPHQQQVVAAAIAAGGGFSIECRVIWPDGSLHWLHIQGKATLDAQGRPVALAGVSQDITERRAAERRLRESQEALRELNETLEQRIDARTAELAQANDRLMREITERERAQVALVQAQKMEAVGQLTGGIAHDFNNLLNVISGNVELIERYSADERVRRMAQTARRSAERGAKLTGQLLAFSRSQSLDLRAVDLKHLMGEVRDLLSAAIGPEIQLEFCMAPDMPRVTADLSQTELAILNLAINARDAMPDGGRLTIECALRSPPAGLLPPGEYAVVSVRDNGQGINPEILGKVFDPFFTTKALGKGTGLGLSQVYGIAQQSGGAARIESRAGCGTTVEIWLPLAPQDQAEEAAARAAEPLRSAGPARILVVEDDPGVRQFIVECLEMSGHRVTQAEHGEAGLAQIESAEPDLMIVDFLMPGMNGAQLAAEVSIKCPNLPIIIATGYADMQEIERVVGKNAVLKKPFQMRDLLESVRAALAR